MVTGCPSNVTVRPAEFLLPVVIAQNNHGVLAQRLSLAAEKEPPGSGLESKPFKEISADVRGHDPVRILPFCRQAVEADGVGKDVAKGLPTLAANLFVFVPGQSLLQRTIIFAGDDGRDLLWIRHRQRLEQK
jgi:hypothetical protein